MVAEHPQCFLQANFVHLGQGEMKILDVTRLALQTSSSSIRDVVNAGFDLIRLDFLFLRERTSSFPVAMMGYRLGLTMIRDIAGEEVTLVAVGAPPIAGFDIVDSWRVGPDIAVELFEASWLIALSGGYSKALASRWALCAYMLCDRDCQHYSAVSQNEVTTGLWTSALGGGGLFFSDDLRQLDPSRQQWVTSDIITLLLSGHPSRPARQVRAS